MLRVLLRTNALDDRVRKTLVETLYTQPANLAIGAVTGVLCSLVAASYSPDRIFLEIALLLTAIAVARIIMAVMLPRLRNYANFSFVRKTIFSRSVVIRSTSFCTS